MRTKEKFLELWGRKHSSASQEPKPGGRKPQETTVIFSVSCFLLLLSASPHCWRLRPPLSLSLYLLSCNNQQWLPRVSQARLYAPSVQFSSVQSLSVRLFATPWIAARQASLSITNSWSLLKLMSLELVMPSNHLILCHPLLFLPSIFPSIRVFSNESVLHIR